MIVKKRICVMGLGYIGLPTAALLANRSYNVMGVDLVRDVVDTINRSEIHIAEPDLDTFVRAAVGSGKLVADVEPGEADLFIIAVPTPFNDGYVPNIDYVLSASRSIAPFVRPGGIVIVESTIPVGTTERVAQVLAENGVDVSRVHVAHCPERVLPGRIMHELVHNDRVVGGLTPEATKEVADFYATFVKGEILSTDARTAEMTKLAENSFRDVNIAFANELSMLCSELGIDAWELIRLANRHPRVNILQPGSGVGGHCIAVDPWFIVNALPGLARLIRTAREVNSFKTKWIIENIENAALRFSAEHGRKAAIACLGLTFKPNIDDLRQSPALHIASELEQRGHNILAVEPNLRAHPPLPLVSLEEALDQADILALLVAHKEFSRIGSNRDARILDFCGCLK